MGKFKGIQTVYTSRQGLFVYTVCIPLSICISLYTPSPINIIQNPMAEESEVPADIPDCEAVVLLFYACL